MFTSFEDFRPKAVIYIEFKFIETVVILTNRIIAAMYDTYEECAVGMQKHFIIGSTDGQLVASMNRMMETIYPTALDTQYRHPNATNYNLFAVQDSKVIEDISVLRPSDYRLKNSMSMDANKTCNDRGSNIRTCFKEVIDPFVESVER